MNTNSSQRWFVSFMINTRNVTCVRLPNNEALLHTRLCITAESWGKTTISIWSQIFSLGALCFYRRTQTHTSPSAKTAIPEWKKPTTFPGTQCGFILMIKEKTRHPQKKRRLTLTLSFFSHYLVWSWSRRAGTRPHLGRSWSAASSGQSPGADGVCGSKWRRPRVPGQWGAAQDSLEAPDQPGKGEEKKGDGDKFLGEDGTVSKSTGFGSHVHPVKCLWVW